MEDDDSPAHAIQVAHASPCEQSTDKTMQPITLPTHDRVPGMRGVGQLAGRV